MFSLILDDYAYTDPGDCCKQHIAGPAQNRWPDKSFSVVMGHCGKAGVVFEGMVLPSSFLLDLKLFRKTLKKARMG